MTGYELYSDLGLSGDYSLIYNGASNSNTLSYTHTNLTPGLKYSYYVKVLNFNGPSAVSTSASKSACTAPQSFTSVAVSAVSSAHVLLTWSPPTSNGGCSIESYSVSQDNGANGAFSVLASSLGPSTFSYNITSGITSTTTYRFKVIATNDIGSTEGNIVQTIIADVPDTPTAAPTMTIDGTDRTSLKVTMAQITGTGGSAIQSYHL